MPNKGPRDQMVCPRFVAQMMDGRGITQVMLAQRVDRSQGFISKVLAGLQPVPWEDLAAWAAALELTPEQASLLKRYAIRSYGPACANEVVDALDDAKAQLAAHERELAALSTTVDVLKRHTEALEREREAMVAELAAARATAEALRRSG